MKKIRIPYNYIPRKYQVPFFENMSDGYLRAVLVWHRRSGKEKTCINFTIMKMLERVGTYFYGFPELNQGRKILWEGMDKDGFRFLDHFPSEIIDGTPNNTDMKIRLKNGSLFQVVGSDRYNSLIGTNPAGMVFSEYSLQDPQAWGYFRPILAENKGWAVFNFTPRGDNHALDILNVAKSDTANWFSQILTADDTKAIPSDILVQENREIIQLYGNDSLYRQEYYCDFTVPIIGAYYADNFALLYKEGRICSLAHEPSLPVSTWWDLGVGDKMVIWFSQQVGNEVRLVDYEEDTGKGLDFFIKILKEKPYIYAGHNAPHDIRVREMLTAKSRLELASSLGIDFSIVPNIPVIDGINAARSILRRCWFDKEKCKNGINALKNYRKQYDETRKTYNDAPYHDWASNGADAFRYMAVGMGYEIVPQNGSFDLQKKAAQNTGWTHPKFRKNSNFAYA